MLVELLEARAERRASSAHWAESNPLAGFVDLDFMNLGVKIEHIHALRPLAFEDRARLASNRDNWRALMEPEQSTAMATSPTPSLTTPGR
ncbi:MAG TPA: hypothetical protein VGR47_06685 [Terracidiphilus sp.]|nr:hypothetical protein [Terracidiphilus sp.]